MLMIMFVAGIMVGLGVDIGIVGLTGSDRREVPLGVFMELIVAAGAAEADEAVVVNQVKRFTHRAKLSAGHDAHIERVVILLLFDDRVVDLGE